MESILKIKNAALKYLGDKKLIETPIEQLLSQTLGHQETIIPIYQLDEIASHTFNFEQYQQIIQYILRTLDQEYQKTNQIIKTMILVDYLLQYGCSGCIDDFRDNIPAFKWYLSYQQSEDKEKIEIVRNKAQHIMELLVNQNRLNQQKEIAQLVQRQLQNQQNQSIQNNIEQQNQNKQNVANNNNKNQSSNDQQENGPKLEDLVENYFFKYLDKMSDQLDDLSQVINVQVDQYIEKIKKEYFDEDGDQISQEQARFPEPCIQHDVSFYIEPKGTNITQILKSRRLNMEENKPTIEKKPEEIKKKEDLIDFKNYQQNDAIHRSSDLIEFESNDCDFKKQNESTNSNNSVTNQNYINYSHQISPPKQAKPSSIKDKLSQTNLFDL